MSPSPGDILHAANFSGWPAVNLAGFTIPAGEAAWQRVIESMSLDERGRFWSALGATHTSTVAPAGAAQRRADQVNTKHQSPGVQPSNAEFGVLLRAYETARKHGLTVDPSAFTVHWFTRDCGDEVAGLVDYSTTPIQMWLSRGLSEHELHETVLHELQHVSDAVTFGAAFRAMPTFQREARAESFVTMVLGPKRSRI